MWPFSSARDATREPVEVEVESVVVLVLRATAVVLARVPAGVEFVLGNHPTLDGCRIQPFLTQPRAVSPDGLPRRDLYAFELRSISDAERFHPGDLVLLVP